MNILAEALAVGWDADGNGLVSWWESSVAILLLTAAVSTALFVIAKNIRKAWRAVDPVGKVKSIIDVAHWIREFRDDWQGTPGEGGLPRNPGIMETVHVLKCNQEAIKEQVEQVAVTAATVAVKQEETALEVASRLDQGSVTMAAMRQDIAVVQRITADVAKIVGYELNTNSGESMKDKSDKTHDDTVKIKSALIRSGMMEVDDDNEEGHGAGEQGPPASAPGARSAQGDLFAEDA